MKDVVTNRHAANIFLAFLMCRTSYVELGLWMSLHFELFQLFKNSQYPDCIESILNFIMMRPMFVRDSEEVWFNS